MSGLSPVEFRPFRLISITPVNRKCSTFRFALADDAATVCMPVTSCLHLRATLPTGEIVIRQYTPISSNSDRGFVELLIKTLPPPGKMCQCLLAMKPGDQIEMMGPEANLFKYGPDIADQVGMIAGGFGVIPMLQILNEALRENTDDKTRFTLLYGCDDEADILLRPRLERLAKDSDRFTLQYVFGQGPAGWTGPTGLINAEIIAKYLPRPGPNTSIFMCGPPPMLRALSSVITTELGYPKERLNLF